MHSGFVYRHLRRLEILIETPALEVSVSRPQRQHPQRAQQSQHHHEPQQRMEIRPALMGPVK